MVTAGPRFAVTGQGAGVDSLADEQDGLVTVPFEVDHRPSIETTSPLMRGSIFISVPHGTSAGNMLRSGGLLDRVLDADRSLRVVLLSPMSRDAAFVREFSRDRVQFVDQPAHTPPGLRARPLAILPATQLEPGRGETV